MKIKIEFADKRATGTYRWGATLDVLRHKLNTEKFVSFDTMDNKEVLIATSTIAALWEATEAQPDTE